MHTHTLTHTHIYHHTLAAEMHQAGLAVECDSEVDADAAAQDGRGMSTRRSIEA